MGEGASRGWNGGQCRFSALEDIPSRKIASDASSFAYLCSVSVLGVSCLESSDKCKENKAESRCTAGLFWVKKVSQKCCWSVLDCVIVINILPSFLLSVASSGLD